MNDRTNNADRFVPSVRMVPYVFLPYAGFRFCRHA